MARRRPAYGLDQVRLRARLSPACGQVGPRLQAWLGPACGLGQPCLPWQLCCTPPLFFFLFSFPLKNHSSTVLDCNSSNSNTPAPNAPQLQHSHQPSLSTLPNLFFVFFFLKTLTQLKYFPPTTSDAFNTPKFFLLNPQLSHSLRPLFKF